MLSACSFRPLVLSAASAGESVLARLFLKAECVTTMARGSRGHDLSLIEGKCKCQQCLEKNGLLVSDATWNKLWQMEKALQATIYGGEAERKRILAEEEKNEESCSDIIVGFVLIS